MKIFRIVMKHHEAVGFAVARTEKSGKINCQELIKGGFNLGPGNWVAACCKSLSERC